MCLLDVQKVLPSISADQSETNVKFVYSNNWFNLKLVDIDDTAVCSVQIELDQLFQEGTVCPVSSDPFYIASLLYKLGHYLIDIL